MQDAIRARTERARELLLTVQHAAMATVNDDGSPHNTPYFFMCSSDVRQLYWGSHPESGHSKNIMRTGQLFVVLYDAYARGGLFIRASGGRIAEGDELYAALKEHNRRRAERDLGSLPIDNFQGRSPQRMYIAETKQFWVNLADRDKNGNVIRDNRIEIQRKDLLSK